jgi:hypothetical protein
MNNNDLYKNELKTGNYLMAAKLAVEFARGKGSRAGAWDWAKLAKEAAELGGITLNMGDMSWPDLDLMQAEIEAAMGLD